MRSFVLVASVASATTNQTTRQLRGSCIPSYHVNCMQNPNCCDPTTTCYAKDQAVAVCLQSCEPGIHSNDLPQYRTPWSCDVVGKQTPVVDHRPMAEGKCTQNYHVNCMHNPTCCDPNSKCYAKDRAVAICLHSCEPGIHLNDPPQWQTPWSCSLVSPSPPSSPSGPSGMGPLASLLRPSDGKLMDFVMYRAQNDANYPLENVNAGNLEGIMWYLQNEVLSGVYGPGPKFGITRILRIRVQVRATQPLLDKGMNFGIRVAFDSGKCTGPDCAMDWHDYGYNVGCNKLGDWPFPTYDTHFEGGIWYSLPGSCPSLSYLHKSDDSACKMNEPGGKCSGVPTGAGDCTWNYENAGELQLTELYRETRERSFWAGNSNAENRRKVQVAKELFAAKYGPDPPVPPCDFDEAKIFGR